MSETTHNIPEKTKQNLTELARAITELQQRHNIILETLVDSMGMTGNEYKIGGQYDTIIFGDPDASAPEAIPGEK